MTIYIEKVRAEMAVQQRQLAWENRRFALSLAIAAPALVGAGIAIGNHFKPAPASPPPQVIILQQPSAASK